MKNKYMLLVAVCVSLAIICIGCSNGNVNDENDENSYEEELDEEDLDSEELEEENAEGDEIIAEDDEEDKEEEEKADDEEDTTMNSEYILNSSDMELVSSLSLSELTSEELRIARNELYARHGLVFGSEDLAEYFAGQTWYEPSVEQADDVVLNEIEQLNLELIQEMEKLKSEEICISTCVWSMESLQIVDGYWVMEVEEDGLTEYITYTGSWDYLATRAISFPIANDCEWYFCSPIAYNENYEDAIISSESEVVEILCGEIEAISEAESTGAPYDTSISVIIRIKDQEIVCVYQVAS